MKRGFFALMLLALAAASVPSAFAHGYYHDRPRVIFGLHFGDPYFYGPWPPPYYYSPPIVVTPAPPPVYIERPSAAPEAQSEPYYWYYCAESKTYYPYVKDCPGGWMRVVPQETSPK